MRSVLISVIRALLCTDSVVIPACHPVNEIALYPFACSAIVNNEIVTCSPVDRSISISRLLGFSVIALASATSSSVLFPIAETTETILCPRSYSSIIKFATC